MAVWMIGGSVETGGSELFVSTLKVQLKKGCCCEDVRAINQGAMWQCAMQQIGACSATLHKSSTARNVGAALRVVCSIA